LHGFGAPTALRISVGTRDENGWFRVALGQVFTRA
jgi:hypothetical protein